MLSEQRLHPVSMLFAFWGSLKQFALPGLFVLIAGRSSTGPDGTFGGLPVNPELWTMLFLIPAAVVAVARYLSFRLRYESSELIVRSGILFRNERHIPYTRIQNLEAVRNVFHRAFGVVEVRVENASGKEAEARISVLPMAAFEEMRRRVFEGRAHAVAAQVQTTAEPDARATDDRRPAPATAANEETLLVLSAPDLLLCGFLENRGMVIIAAIYGFLWQLGPLGNVWSRIFDDESYAAGRLRGTVAGIAEGKWPSVGQMAVILGTIAGLLIFVRLVSMAWATVRLYGFHLTLVGQDLRTEFGLFTRVASTTPLRRIQTMTIRESPLHRVVKRVSVRVETAGGSAQPGNRGRGIEREWLAPLARVAALPGLIQTVLPDLNLDTLAWQPVHPRAFRRAVKPAIVVALATAAAFAAMLGWRALGVLPFTLVWFAVGARKYVAHLAWATTEDVVVFRSGWLWRVITVARVAKIQTVSLRESPFDRRWAMARLRVDTSGASDRSHRVDIPYLPRDVAISLHHRLALGAADTDFRW